MDQGYGPTTSSQEVYEIMSRNAHYRNGFKRQWRTDLVESTLRLIKAKLEMRRPKKSFYYPETGCYCAATHAPCGWCTSPDRTEEDFSGRAQR